MLKQLSLMGALNQSSMIVVHIPQLLMIFVGGASFMSCLFLPCPPHYPVFTVIHHGLYCLRCLDFCRGVPVIIKVLPFRLRAEFVNMHIVRSFVSVCRTCSSSCSTVHSC